MKKILKPDAENVMIIESTSSNVTSNLSSMLNEWLLS